MTTLRCCLCGPNLHIYSSREDLEIHVSSHFSYTPYECGDCINASLPYKYPTEYALVRHYKEAHPNVTRFKICKYSSPETRDVGAEVLKAVQQSIALLTITKPYVLPSVASTENSVRNEQFAQPAAMDYITRKKPKIEDEVEVIDLYDEDQNVMETPEDYPKQPVRQIATVVNNASNDVETINLFSESVTRAGTKQDPRAKMKIKEEDISNSAAIGSPVQLSANPSTNQQQSEEMCRVNIENFKAFQDYSKTSHNSTKTQFPETPCTAQVLHVPEVISSENRPFVVPSSDIPEDPRLKRKPIAASTTPNRKLNLYPNRESYESAFQNINQNHPTVVQSTPESSSNWKQDFRHKLRNIIPEEYAQDVLATSVILSPSSSKLREPESQKDRRHYSRKEDKVISRHTSPSPVRSHHKKTRKMLEEREKHHAPEILEQEELCTLFIGSLPLKTTVESLRRFYSQFGKICDCFVKTWPQEAHIRCRWGYVIFSKMKEVDNAIVARPHFIDGKQVIANRYRRNKEHIASAKLLIKGVRKDHTERDLQKYFRGFGEVHNVSMISARRAAVVTFRSVDPVDKCVLIEEHSIAGHRCNATRYLGYI